MSDGEIELLRRDLGIERDLANRLANELVDARALIRDTTAWLRPALDNRDWREITFDRSKAEDLLARMQIFLDPPER